MKPVALLAALPLLIASPALAQHQGHGSMPGMQAPPEQPKPAPKPEPKPDPQKTDEHAGHEAGETEMSWPTTLPDEPADASGSMESMDHSQMPGMDHGDMGVEEPVGDSPAPPPPPDHAADAYFGQVAMDRARAQLGREHGGMTLAKVMLNVGEYQWRDGAAGFRWDGEAWIGGDINRLVIKTEGETARGSGVESAEVQALYSHAVTPYFDLQAGLRQDFEPRGRTFATIGFEGVAPYWFETEGALFLSDRGDVLARLEGTYDLRLTQRWIVQPRVEANLSAQDVPDMEIGSGLTNLEVGVRLRYEIRREFAPYVGVSFDEKFGRTADFARARGEDTRATGIVFGVRAWF